LPPLAGPSQNVNMSTVTHSSAVRLDTLVCAFVDELGAFAYELSSLDFVWNILFPDPKGTWHRLHVNKYKETFYITHVGGDCGSLEVKPGKTLRAANSVAGEAYPGGKRPGQLAGAWEPLITAARRWLRVVRKDWIGANKRVQVEYPLQRRFGVVSNAVIRASLPDLYRLDKELGKAGTRTFVRLVEQGFFMRAENTGIPSMTAADYFQYCRIAYLAGRRKADDVDLSLSGREMYARYADGRHEGLLDIAPNSAREFADWIDGTHPKRGGGGHPWEIKRGGNTTHIDLTVARPALYRKEGFKVELQGESIGRVVETIRMFLAIHEAKLPISIANPEGVRKRLLAQDNIGIVPCYASLHRANQHFGKEQDVFDVMHYDELGRFKRRITPFISWEPLPILTTGLLL
jgi:hypothetical protein